MFPREKSFEIHSYNSCHAIGVRSEFNDREALLAIIGQSFPSPNTIDFGFYRRNN